MLSPAEVEEVRRLLAEGRLSQRQIARLTGISRGTVGAIAQGKRRDPEPRDPPDESPPLGAAAALPHVRRDGVPAVPLVPRAGRVGPRPPLVVCRRCGGSGLAAGVA